MGTGTHAPGGWAGSGRPASSSCGKPRIRHLPWRARLAGQCQSQRHLPWWCPCNGAMGGVSRERDGASGKGERDLSLGAERPHSPRMGSAAAPNAAPWGGYAGPGNTCLGHSWHCEKMESPSWSHHQSPQPWPMSLHRAFPLPPAPSTGGHTHLLTGFLMPCPSEPRPSPSFQPIFISIW